MTLINKYFPNITDQQRQQFGELEELYRFWNAQINVVSRQDVDNLYERHVLHSLAIAKVISFKPFTSVLDVGTGGGFPGIPLAIMFPEAEFHLIDSVGKKIKVVEGVAQSLNLKNVRAQHERAEKADGEYDFVVTRAVTRLKPLLDWTRGKYNKNQFHDLPNGLLALKGGDLEEEITESGRKPRVYDLSDYFEEEFFMTKKVVYVAIGQK
jgi:16S rRNA (guanine527-N7)-methyltransferase